MLRVFVDSGSSIKQHEKEKYQVEIIPLKIILGDKEYYDGINLDNDVFYSYLKESHDFPKTSLPSLGEIEERINEYTKGGDDVIILTISSEISGTYNAMRLLFEDNDKVRVIDSRLAVGGIRLLVDEINLHRDEDLDQIVERVNNLIPRIVIMAIPETLEYLHKGGRLSKMDYILGSLIHIKPIIGFENGKVKMLAKKIGLKNSMSYIVQSLEELDCDPNYEIIPSMTFNKKNLDLLKSMTNEKFYPQMKVIDDLDHAIAAHWGPNAFGYIFVKK